MKKNVVVLSALALLSLSQVSEAKILQSGTSGVINVPSASVRSIGHVSVGVQGTEDGNFVAANVALVPGVEVAASHVNPKHADAFNEFSAKLQFLPETAATPGVAIGVEDVSDKSDRAGYAVASKSLPWGLKAHAGVGTGRFKNGFAALEKSFKLFDVALEYDGHDFNYGASVPFGKFLQAEVGVRSKAAFAGVNFTF